ncbi:M48 metallopeptidase family protein [Hamadaea tsunoensis]|uniref:M48 metallopeptidase family protein n=1 Tax=Hamadaea tsunoensis TaxID=53368 RepID=UPI00047F35D3|nr:M48 family metallopeptidase [Hamadaea tsunoensis]
MAGPQQTPLVEVRRSTRRRRTVAAYREGERVVILMPSQFSRAEESAWIDKMLARLEAKESRGPRSDDALTARAGQLAARYFGDHGTAAVPAGVRWVSNQRGRWGSCSSDERTIRLSDRLRDMPAWVADYVLIHELAHLIEPNHGAAFWRLVGRYPKTERARGFLEGVAAVAGDAYAED